MSSVDATSTNDVSSTAARSETMGSFAADATGRGSNTLTTDAIIKECIKQGFYRNPVCNEKLYLHNHGFDTIAPTAFEPYTDVKVLWLEGNGLSALPCGKGYIQVQPPVRDDPFASPTEEKERRGPHVDPHTPERAAENPDTTTAAAPLPLAQEVETEHRDAFSSLYPTVRQLYLHNNLFREMPDMSRFEQLYTLNLSGNFISKVTAHCPYWEKKRGGYGDDLVAPAAAASGSTAQADTVDRVSVVPPSREAKADREAQLERYQRLADTLQAVCEHNAIPEDDADASKQAANNTAPAVMAAKDTAEDGNGTGESRADQDGEEEKATVDVLGHTLTGVSRRPPESAVEYRNLCSSLNALNLSGNRLESFDDCLGLLAFKSLNVLDLSHNHIADGEALLYILERLPRLKSLKLSGNPLVRTMPRYRKKVLARCKHLCYLDERPVFPEERRLVTAWAHGGDDEEEKERRSIQQGKLEAEKKRLDEFRRLITRHDTNARDSPHSTLVRALTTPLELPPGGNEVTATLIREGGFPRDYNTGESTNGQGAAAAAAAVSNGSRAGQSASMAARRPSSDPDNSPTSAESEEDEDDVDAGHETRATTADQAAIVAEPYENKPVHDASSSDLPPEARQQQQQRLLSSNQRVVAPHAPPPPPPHNDEEDGDIFVPQS